MGVLFEALGEREHLHALARRIEDRHRRDLQEERDVEAVVLEEFGSLQETRLVPAALFASEGDARFQELSYGLRHVGRHLVAIQDDLPEQLVQR